MATISLYIMYWIKKLRIKSTNSPPDIKVTIPKSIKIALLSLVKKERKQFLGNFSNAEI